jgi:hypothetical protein
MWLAKPVDIQRAAARDEAFLKCSVNVLYAFFSDGTYFKRFSASVSSRFFARNLFSRIKNIYQLTYCSASGVAKES